MPTRSLLIEVHLLAGRYHGVGDWPPSPFRVFQALVAGAYGGRWIGESRTEKDAAFRWLERQSPPAIATPSRIRTRAVSFFVPNNDLDAKGGDPARVPDIRSEKQSQGSLFAADQAFLYAWPIEDG